MEKVEAKTKKTPAYRAMENLLGNRVVCTLSDGRQAMGRLICIDRRKNIILSNCSETRTIVSTDYAPDKPRTEQQACRYLQQAMIPGEHLVKLEVEEKTYNEKIAPILDAKSED